MDAKTEEFLTASPIAAKVKLPARVILRRLTLTPRDIAAIKSGDLAVSPPNGETVCDLEVGGRIVARGKVVKKRGGFRFRVREVM